MNSNILSRFAQEVLQTEASWKVQSIFSKVTQAYEHLIQNPQNGEAQTNFANLVADLISRVDQALGDFTPTDLERLAEINGDYWFSSSMTTDITNTIQSNAMTPAVGLKKLKALEENRAQYIETLRTTVSALKKLGVEPYQVEPDEPEVGFQIPRAVFDGDLQKFQREIRQIYVIVKTFQKVADEATDTVELKRLSTSDPLILLGVGLLTLRYIGDAVSWCLDTLIKLETIKEARKAASNVPGMTADELEKFFGHRFELAIEAAIKEKKAELLGSPRAGKHKELGGELEHALKLLLQRIEHGVRVELHFIEPPPAPSDDEPDPHADMRQIIEILQAIDRKLKFTSIENEPVLALTFDESEVETKTPPSKRSD